MTDEAHHIARQAAALDDPRLCRDSGGVSDAQDEALKRRLESLLRELITDQSCGEWGEDTIEADVQTFLPRIMGAVADLACPPEAGDDGAARIAMGALDDIAAGRGMFGIDDAADLKWAMHRAGEALAALAAMDTPKGGGDE